MSKPSAASVYQKLQPEDIPGRTYDLFQPYPWCTSLLENPTLTPIHNPSTRTPHNKKHENTFVNTTLAGDDKIRALVSFYRPPSESLSTGKNYNNNLDYSIGPSPSTPSQFPGEFLTLLLLHPRLNGHENYLHGGVLSTTLDEVMSLPLQMRNRGEPDPFTVRLSVEFKAAVRTPGPMLCRGWITSVEGRKFWTNGRLEGKDEEGKRVLFATGEAMWIIPREQKL